jgi:excisionase family DNA binding protein
MQSSAVADGAQLDLAAALAEIAALLRAASDSIADGDAELAAPNHAPQQSTLALDATADSRRAYTINETARILSVSRSTIHKLINNKSLKTIRVCGHPRITRASVEDLLGGAQ